MCKAPRASLRQSDNRAAPIDAPPPPLYIHSMTAHREHRIMADGGKKQDDGGGIGVMEAPTIPERRNAPLYHVILHNDELHTYDYVVRMLMQLFGKTAEQAFQHACEVDLTGVTIVETTTLERAELKRDQIKAYGKDPQCPDSPGSMYATIEPAD
jgi:ATP-dependent Clp protease adaptor protein ClpS